jgi:UDP-N-acetylglucosamine 1-carboxyvinyltransferase
MPDSYFRITGDYSLNGVVSVSGSKNACFPILAATLLASSPVMVQNVPEIEDIRCFLAILADLGCSVEMQANQTVLIDPRPVHKTTISTELGQKIRGSYYLLGSLLTRFGQGAIPYPGGCLVGDRPMDLHVTALRQLGFTMTETAKGVQGERTQSIQDEHTIVFPFPSRGATINLLLTSSLLPEHTSILRNANSSPETLALCTMLQNMGIQLEGVGTRRLVVHGSHALQSLPHPIRVIPDKIEAATFLCAGLLTGGSIRVKDVLPHDLDPFLDVLKDMGVTIQTTDNSIQVHYSKELRSTDICAGLEAGSLDADWEPLLAVLLCRVPGTSTIQDSINPDRHSKFLPELERMGACIEYKGKTTASLHGGRLFYGADVTAHDIRGGAALTLAALAAQGASIIRNVQQIDRGYERIEEKLRQVGAHIERHHELPVPTTPVISLSRSREDAGDV